MSTNAPHLAFVGVGIDGKTSKVDIIKAATGGYWIDALDVLHGPNVTYKPLPEASKQPLIIPRSAIMHSQSGPKRTSWQALWTFLARPDVDHESHTIANLDGSIVQLIPFTRRADCNAKANAWLRNGKIVGALSCETQDEGAPTLDRTPWPLAQFTSTAGMLAAQAVAYRIACTAPTTWDDTGIGHHSLFKQWSIYAGKTCPGAARIRQMDELRRLVASQIATFYQYAGGTCPGGKP